MYWKSIKLVEPYYYSGPDENIQLNYYGMYGPSEPGKEYIFILTQIKDRAEIPNAYYPTYGHKSRFPMPTVKAFSTDRTQSEEDFDLLPDEYPIEFEVYQGLYDEVIERCF